MMRTFAIFIALATLTTGLLFAGGASAADGNPCGSSSFYNASASDYSVWRIEVREDEAAYVGPSIHDRLNHHWNQTAKRTYRWTSAAMPIDAGVSTQLMTISAAVIAEGVPALRRGDIIDVYVVQGFDYSEGRAPVVVRRVCGGRDLGCMDGLRKTQEGRVAGVEVRGADQGVSYRKRFPPAANVCCSAPRFGCGGEMAAMSH